MNGSEKQIKWAEDIRATATKAIFRFVEVDVAKMKAQAIHKGMSQEQADASEVEFVNAAQATVEMFQRQDDAKWWIDRSNNTVKQWMMEARNG